MTPQESDIKLAQLYYERLTLERRRTDMETAMKHAVGAEFRYDGRKRVTDMTIEEARAKVNSALADPDSYDRAVYGRGYFILQQEVEDLERLYKQLEDNRAQYDQTDNAYTGWARYFLTISSRGHIHSSMECSSCREMTVFGWLPHLAGKGEVAVVEEHGPTLCSVCFPTAPAEWKSKDIPRDEALRRLREMAQLIKLDDHEVFVRKYGERR